MYGNNEGKEPSLSPNTNKGAGMKMAKLIELVATNKKEIEVRAGEWVDARVNMEEMDSKVQGLIEWLIEDGEVEDGSVQAWAGTIVGSSYGQFAQLALCDEVLGWSVEGVMTWDDMTDEYTDDKTYTISEAIGGQGCLADDVGDAIEKLLNEKTSLPGNYWVGFHEADGSLGILYSQDVEE